jgi:hypothetical protein
MDNETREKLSNLYSRYCKSWLWCLDFLAGLPFFAAGFLVRFAREWFLIGGGLYNFLNEMNQRTKQRGVNQ